MTESATTTALRPTLRERALATVCLLLGTLLALPPQVYSAQQSITDFRLLDRSWQLSMPGQLSQGQLSGRDFIYTYGPLYQLTHALGLAIPPGDLAQSLRFHDLVEVLLALAGVWWLLSLMPARLGVRGLLYLAWALLLAAPGEFFVAHLKPMAAPPLVAMCLLALRAAAQRPSLHSRVLLALAWSTTPVVLTLYSFEFGVFALGALWLAALIVVLSTVRTEGGRTRALRASAVLAVAASLVGVILYVALFSLLPGWHDYLPRSRDLIEAYGQMMPLALAPGSLVLLVVALAVGLATVALAARHLRRSILAGESTDAAPWVLLAVGCLSIVMIRYGLTRSDTFHIYVAIAPAALVVCCLAPAIASTIAVPPWAPLPWWLPTAALYLLVVLRSEFHFGWQQRLTHLGQLSLRAAEVVIDDPVLRSATERLRALPETQVLVWPRGAIVNLLADKGNPCYTLQVTEGAIGRLEQLTVARWIDAGHPPVLAFFGLRNQAAGADLGRNNVVLRHLLDHYQLAEPPQAAWMLLRASPLARWQERELPIQVQFDPRQGQAAQIALGSLEVRASDLIELRLTVEGGPWPLVGKPGLVAVILVAGDGRRTTRTLFVPADGLPHKVLITALELGDPMFLSAFQPGRWWRSTERLEALQLAWIPLDFLSRPPHRITCDRLVALERPDVETRETPLADQRSPDTWRWCFGAEPPQRGQPPQSTPAEAVLPSDADAPDP